MMVLVPVPAILYFQHSLDQISLELAAGTQLPRTDALGASPAPSKPPGYDNRHSIRPRQKLNERSSAIVHGIGKVMGRFDAPLPCEAGEDLGGRRGRLHGSRDHVPAST
jgi:hypothetical protein